ncbi:hypothetical protein GSN00_07365 [Cylindrospermopsis raciborskii CHAB3438]|uniref:septal junction protein FraD n=1 Tax=Cylindrospermopsis raciborskii TaxID=77022 RepID=UPI001F0CEA02|nr:septal junction protein FraD [Cylindrospermopsis raciborskii]MCH4904208.1 hypothetical protein [Cylindrospermopsis raciborskii CHAB3438]
MNFPLLKEIIQLFTFIKDLFLGIQKLLMPPRSFSWQTFIYLSIFSWGISYLATGIIKDIIAFTGWIFLFTGTAWYTTDSPVRVPGTFMPVGALLTGFIFSVFAFGHGENAITVRTIVLWPTIAAIITALPQFFTGDGISPKATLPKLEVRQKIILLLSWSMLISCWLQFNFVTDKWLKEYPSLSAQSFQRSNFVIKFEPKASKPEPGNIILHKIEPLILQQITNRPWSEVERWLLEANQQVGNLGKIMINKNLREFEEKGLWKIEPRVVNIKSGYRLDLLSIWQGPTDSKKGFYLRKSCYIEPIASEYTTDNKNVKAKIKCDRKTKFFRGSPPAQQ